MDFYKVGSPFFLSLQRHATGNVVCCKTGFALDEMKKEFQVVQIYFNNLEPFGGKTILTRFLLCWAPTFSRSLFEVVFCRVIYHGSYVFEWVRHHSYGFLRTFMLTGS